MLGTDPVQKILHELRRPQLGDVDDSARTFRQLKPSRQDAKRKIAKDNDGQIVFETVNLPIGFGTLVYTTTDDTEHAYLKFDDEARYPRVVHGVRSSSDATLAVRDTDLVFNSTVGGEEIEEIADLVDANISDIEAIESTAFEGYAVWATDDMQSSSDSSSLFKVDSELQSAEVIDNPEDAEIQIVACASLAMQCIKWFGPCAACATSCTVSGPVCAACLVLTCGATGGICGVFAAECVW